jgi:hypothetical protein
MSKTMRSLLLAICAAQLFFAVAFFFQWPLAVNLWPFEGTTPLTYIFIASIFAAAAASTLWPIITGNYGALAGVGLDYAVILAPMSAYILWLGLAGGDSGKIIYGVICAGGALFGLWLFWWSQRLPMPDESIPIPPLVRWSFIVFVVALLYTSTRLFLQIPTIPWPLTPELSVIVGCIFLGAAAYFIYALLRPSWANAGGQLSGFLMYDLVPDRALPHAVAGRRAGVPNRADRLHDCRRLQRPAGDLLPVRQPADAAVRRSRSRRWSLRSVIREAWMSTREIYNALEVSDTLITGGQPTADQLRDAAVEGFAAVINLATTNPPHSLEGEGALVESLGMEYVHIPVDWNNPTDADFAAFEAAVNRCPARRCSFTAPRITA